MNFPGRRDQRRKEAAERDALRASLSLEDKYILCEERPGESKSEMARIVKQIRKRDNTTPVKKEEKKKKEPARTDKKAIKARKKKEDAE